MACQHHFQDTTVCAEFRLTKESYFDVFTVTFHLDALNVAIRPAC